jgi:hypothetical protein
MNWQPIETAPENVMVMTRIDDGNGIRNEQILHRNGNMWYGGDMYVYYCPTHWRSLTQIERLKEKNMAEAKAVSQMEFAHRLLGVEQ